MEWIIEDSANGKRIVDYLREEKSFSRRIVKAIKFDGGEIFVNGCQCTVGDRLTVGDTLSITFPPEEGEFKGFTYPIEHRI
ncbi:hypothetical protein RWD45_03930 [Virgibacillus soli]|uniref:RNA-binding S4 domain-containing protein n=1 Tax=Paracerasibacillus soli TaxID=480284 RepID=A0ABU5CNV4_9BACI|nr:hypothetical protein [Virgibacillus soli]MDY0407915.1 hypothetical protein [Virgibacillus soli]